MREKASVDRARDDALRETKFPPTFANLSSVIIHAHSHPSPPSSPAHSHSHATVPARARSNLSRLAFESRARLASTPLASRFPFRAPTPHRRYLPRASPRASELSTPSRVLARVQSSPSVRPPRVSRPASFARASHLSHPPRARSGRSTRDATRDANHRRPPRHRRHRRHRRRPRARRRVRARGADRAPTARGDDARGRVCS